MHRPQSRSRSPVVTSIPVVISSVRVPRSARARAAVACLVTGFALAPHLVRMAAASWLADPTASAISGAMLTFALALAVAGGVSGHPTWGGLDLDEVVRWSHDAVLCVAIAIALFVPAALLALGTPPLAAALAGVVLPAATEEFAYRGVLLVALVRLLPACKVRADYRTALALLLGSVAFAAAHDPLLTPDRSLAAALQRGTAGLLLGFVALRSRSLLAPMFAHAAFNAVVLAPGFGP